MRCRSRLASESGEMDRARLRLRRGVTRGLENRDAVTDNKRHVITSSTHIMKVQDLSIVWGGVDGLIFNTEETLLGKRVNRALSHRVAGFAAAGITGIPCTLEEPRKQRLEGCFTVLVWCLTCGWLLKTYWKGCCGRPRRQRRSNGKRPRGTQMCSYSGTPSSRSPELQGCVVLNVYTS